MEQNSSKPAAPPVSEEYERFFRRQQVRLSSMFKGVHFSRTLWLRDAEQQAVKPLKIYSVHDMDSNVKHCALFVPMLGAQREAEAIAATARDLMDDVAKGVVVVRADARRKLAQPATNTSLIFPNKVTLFTDVLRQDPESVHAAFQAHGLVVAVYDEEHWDDLMRSRRPDRFICHDSRDEEAFVRPLVHALAPHMLKVWYDEHSLSVGDSLIDKIEEGLQTRRFGVMVVSPNLIANHRWPKREFRSLVTRDIEDGHGLILPVWLNVGRRQVRDYSLDLADRHAVRASGAADADQVARTLAAKVKENPENPPT